MSFDWYYVQASDAKVQQQTDGTFPQLDTSLVLQAGDYLIYWIPPYNSYDVYIKESDSYITVAGPPTVYTFVSNTYNLNEEYVTIYRKGTIGFQDQYQLFTNSQNWTLGNEVGDIVTNDKSSL